MDRAHVVSVTLLARRCAPLFALFLAACHYYGMKELPGNHCLVFEDETYSIRARGCGLFADRSTLRGPGNSDPIEGAVSNVGWDDRYIVAWRVPESAQDRRGYMILDTQGQTVEGPYSHEEFAALCRKSPVLARIEVLWARDAMQR